MPIFVTLLVSGNVNDEESSLGVGLKGMYMSSVSWEWRSHEPKGCTCLLSVGNGVHMNQRDVHVFCQLGMAFT